MNKNNKQCSHPQKIALVQTRGVVGSLSADFSSNDTLHNCNRKTIIYND